MDTTLNIWLALQAFVGRHAIIVVCSVDFCNESPSKMTVINRLLDDRTQYLYKGVAFKLVFKGHTSPHATKRLNSFRCVIDS